MGKRGAKPQPSVIKLIKGNPGKRPLNPNEPQPEPILSLDPPAKLSDLEKEFWREIVPDLQALGLLTVVDKQELIRYCQFSAICEEAVQFIKQNGLTYPIKNNEGRVVGVGQWPQVKTAKEYAKYASQLAGKFGLSPSDRTGLAATPSKAKNKFQEFMSRKNGV